MRKFVVAAVFVAAALGSGAPAAGDAERVALRQSATVFIAEPTLIGNTIVTGPVLFVHDDGKMARGEPCTSVRLVDPASGPTEEIAAFHCIPRRGSIVNRFTLTTVPERRSRVRLSVDGLPVCRRSGNSRGAASARRRALKNLELRS